jgi:hypothetical protein
MPYTTLYEILLLRTLKHIITPFRIEDAQSNRSNPFISAPEGGILNENWCKNNEKSTVLNEKIKMISI